MVDSGYLENSAASLPFSQVPLFASGYCQESADIANLKGAKLANAATLSMLVWFRMRLHPRRLTFVNFRLCGSSARVAVPFSNKKDIGRGR